jgi:GT2 family glycosyltransferase
MTDRPRITISLLTWNGSKYLPWLLKSLEAQTFQDWELLVLDNDSKDDSVNVVKENYPPAKIIKQKTNIGFAKGHNLLINWSKSDYVLFLNQDAILAEDYLAKTVEWLDNNPNVATVSGKLLYWNFSETALTKTIDSFGLKINRQRKVIDWQQGTEDYKINNKEVFGVSGAIFLARRAALETIKIPRGKEYFEYFDEDFFAYKEDVDLAWRLRLRGWENWLITDTKAHHHRTVASAQSMRQSRKDRGMANKLSYRNHLATVYKNSFAVNVWKDIFYILFYEVKKFIYLLIFERKTLAGLFSFFSLRAKLKQKKKHIKQTRRVKSEDIYQWFK